MTFDGTTGRLIPGTPSTVSQPRGKEFYIGVDLGQAQDPTALCALEQYHEKRGNRFESCYRCLFLDRLKLGTLYPAIVEHVRQIVRSDKFKPNCFLVVDATGVGRPVVDMLRQAGLRPTAITITGGDSVTNEGGMTRVPKRELVSVLQVLMQNDRLALPAASPYIDALTKELLNFKVKISDNGHDSYSAWRESDHDDLVLSLALAAWKAERGTSRVYSF